LWERIEAVQADPAKGRGVAGYRKMWHLLKRDGIEVARCTVARLMREHGMQGLVRGKKFVTTKSDPASPRPADHVRRDFTAAAPNRLWIVDFTYVPTWQGMAFTAFVKDAYSRVIVGWRTHHRMPTELPLDALEMALWVRDRAGQDVTGLVHHSDAGAQYTAIRYADRLAQVGAIASIGTVGDSYDNAMAESVISLYKGECVRRDGPFRTVDELELATLMWVDWYNTGRLHSSIGYVPPAEYEATYYAYTTHPEQPVPGQLTLH
jgi:putative transposase